MYVWFMNEIFFMSAKYITHLSIYLCMYVCSPSASVWRCPCITASGVWRDLCWEYCLEPHVSCLLEGLIQMQWFKLCRMRSEWSNNTHTQANYGHYSFKDNPLCPLIIFRWWKWTCYTSSICYACNHRCSRINPKVPSLIQCSALKLIYLFIYFILFYFFAKTSTMFIQEMELSNQWNLLCACVWEQYILVYTSSPSIAGDMFQTLPRSENPQNKNTLFKYILGMFL